MRLGKVSITGFGGFSGTVELDLSADVVILQGANGLGKSTVCDAVAWCLAGIHPRGADPRSLYSLAGETHAAVELVDGPSDSWTVRRKISNPGAERLAQLESTLVVEGDHAHYHGRDAEAWVARFLLRAPNTAEAEPSRLLVDSYYLQQESLREFLVGRSDDERFAALSTMVGAGALEDFVRAFETARRAWAKSLKEQQDQLEHLAARLSAARTRCAALEEELSRAGQVDLPDMRDRWLSTVRRVLQRLERAVPQDLTLDLGIELLRDLDLEWRRLAEAIRIALAEVEGVRPPEVPDGSAIAEASISHATAAVHDAASDRERAAEAVRATRRALEAQRAQREDLAGLATIALRHISENCPTCGQSVDPAGLQRRLETMLQGSPADPLASALEQAIRVEEEIARRLTERVAELTRLQSVVDAEQRGLAARRAYEVRQQEAIAHLDDLLESAALAVDRGHEVLDPSNRGRRARALLDRLRELQVELSELLAEGGSLESRVQAVGKASTLRVAEMQASETDRAHDEKAAAVAGRRATAAVADLLMREMKRDSEEFLNSRLREMQPLLDQLYAAIEPHPTFQSISLETRNWYGKNRLDAVARDTSRGVAMPDPGRSLSTSQANAMAVTVFLAFNLGLAPTALQTVVLDDPLQNLDDVHLLGLVDLLRRIAPHRQIVVTTHDRHFGSLLARKLRPLDASRQVSVVDIVSWDRSGPTFGVAHVQPDLEPMKLAAAVA